MVDRLHALKIPVTFVCEYGIVSEEYGPTNVMQTATATGWIPRAANSAWKTSELLAMVKDECTSSLTLGTIVSVGNYCRHDLILTLI